MAHLDPDNYYSVIWSDEAGVHLGDNKSLKSAHAMIPILGSNHVIVSSQSK